MIVADHMLLFIDVSGAPERGRQLLMLRPSRKRSRSRKKAQYSVSQPNLSARTTTAVQTETRLNIRVISFCSLLINLVI